MAVRKRGDTYLADFILRGDQRAFRFLTQEEAHKIIKLFTSWEQRDLADFVIFATHTGARLQQLLDVTWQQFGPSYNTVLFSGGDKKSPPRTLPLSSTTRSALMDQKTAFSDSKAHRNDADLRTPCTRRSGELRGGIGGSSGGP